MNIESFAGTWTLIGSTSINGEISFIDEEPDPNGVRNWLNGKGAALRDEVEPNSGLTLSIAANGSFTEQVEGDPNVYWFDSEGVLVSEVVPFGGFLKLQGENAYLQPSEIPSRATPDDEYNVVLRYDDGDTKICDCINLVGDTLIRTVNVVTDELYLDRVIIVYQKR